MRTFVATYKDQYIQEITLNPNTYTFQAYVKGSRFSIGFLHDDGLTWENHNLDWQVIADDFQHVKYTFTLNNRATLFSLMNSMPSTQVEIVAPFLELGTNASTPKPNELDGMETTENLINEAIIKATFWVINSSSPVIYKDSVNATTAGVHTPITIQGELKRGATTTVGGYLTITANGDTESTTALASPRTLSPSDTDGKTTYTIRLYDKATGGVLLDTMTIPVVFKGASGISALNAVLSNEADVLPSSADGLTTDFTNSGTSVRVFEGSRELLYNKTVTSAGSYNVDAIGTNATPANPNYSTGGYCTYGNITAMDNDKATITFTISGFTFENVAFTLIKKQSLSKSRIGANGQTSYLHIAYATNANGTEGFDVSDPTGKTYIGQYVDFDPEDSKDPKKYTWMLIKGADGNDTETYTLILSRTGVYDYETDSVKVDVLYTKGATSLMLDKNSALSRKTYVYVFDGKEAVSSGEGGTSIDVGSSYRFKTLCPGGQYVTLGLIRNIGDSWTLLESKTISVVKGEDGNPAVNVLIHPSQVIVNTDDNGLVGTNSTLLANAKTTAVAYKAGVEVDCSINTVSTSTGISYSVTGKTLSVTEIKQDPDTKYAYASGWIDFMVTVDGIDYPQRLSVGTNIHAVIAQFIVDNESEHKSITASVTSVRDDAATDAQNKANAALEAAKTYTTAQLKITEGNIATKVEQSEYNENDQLLKSRMSTIEQKADSISLKVSETVLKGNLLAGTMFRRESEVTWNNPAYKGVISTAVQYGETNSVYLESTSETDVYKGVKWAKIPVTAGKTYNISFWYRTPDDKSNGTFATEVQAFKSDGNHAAGFRPLVEWELPIPANDTWKLYSADMTVGSDVAAVDVLIYLANKGKMYVARPMLIEDSYVGWQRSEQDYDYIGGNLLDETKTLAQRGNLTHVDGAVTGNAFGWCSEIYTQGEPPYTDMLRWLIPYDLNADYTLSFMAKGAGKIQTHIYSDAGAADVALFTERECEDYDVDVWGTANYTLTPDWKRRTVRWRTKGTRTQADAFVVIRVEQSSEAYIAQPKLEKGCVATAWTEDDGDMVSTKALLATGVDITNRKVVVTADNVEVRNNSGETTALLDGTGKIQTNLVVASVIRTGDIGRPHVEAKGSEFKIFGYEAFAFIEMAWREDVGSVLRFNNEKTGQALYDLGPDGILDNIATVPDKWTIMPLKSLTTSSRIAAILNVTENDCTPFYQFVEGYKQLNGMKQYNVSGTSSPSGYSGKMYVQQSYNSAVISDGWYVGVNNGNYMVAGASTSLYMCNLMSISGGKVTNSVVCYFTDADTSSLRAPKSVGRDKDGIALNQATYPYLWSYGVGLAE